MQTIPSPPQPTASVISDMARICFATYSLGPGKSVVAFVSAPDMAGTDSRDQWWQRALSQVNDVSLRRFQRGSIDEAKTHKQVVEGQRPSASATVVLNPALTLG